MWAALGVLAILIAVSALYSGMPAYRQLRAERERAWREELERCFRDAAERAKAAGLNVEDMLGTRDWYISQLKLERKLYGAGAKPNRLRLPSRDLRESDLQDQLDRERTGVFVSQWLFLIVIGCLFAARL